MCSAGVGVWLVLEIVVVVDDGVAVCCVFDCGVCNLVGWPVGWPGGWTVGRLVCH